MFIIIDQWIIIIMGYNIYMELYKFHGFSDPSCEDKDRKEQS